MVGDVQLLLLLMMMMLLLLLVMGQLDLGDPPETALPFPLAPLLVGTPLTPLEVDGTASVLLCLNKKKSVLLK